VRGKLRLATILVTCGGDWTLAGDDDGGHYVVTGGGRAGLYPVHEHPNMARSDASHHYVRLEFGDTIHGNAVRVDGLAADEFTIAHRP
jgi:hypothetical protein